MSPYLMGFCAENRVAVSFLTEYGRFLASIQGEVSGNVLLRREQYRRADDLGYLLDENLTGQPEIETNQVWGGGRLSVSQIPAGTFWAGDRKAAFSVSGS